MSARKPFTLRDRKGMCQDFGHRPLNGWGAGTLPAPWCSGDVVELVDTPQRDHDGDDRLRGQTGPFFVVSYACSIDEGDGWYFRVYDGNGDHGSDRMHVVYAERSDWDTTVDWMAPFRLVETPDPDGLAERQRLLADGWSVEEVPCPACDGTGTHTREART